MSKVYTIRWLQIYRDWENLRQKLNYFKFHTCSKHVLYTDLTFKKFKICIYDKCLNESKGYKLIDCEPVYS